VLVLLFGDCCDCNVTILGSISTNTIESAGIWLDHAEGLSLSQFLGEWGFVSF